MKLFMRLGLLALVVVVVAAACTVSYEVGKGTTKVTTSAGLTFRPIKGTWTSNNVPVKTCTSTYGISTSPTKHASRQLRMTSASKVASELTFYTDADHVLTPVLGPAGWNCSASQGADGTSTISIYPPGVRDPVGASNGTEETMGIEETMIPACQGCLASLECPVFLNAEDQLGYNGQYCPGYMPSSESVRFLEGDAESDYGVAVLSDPPRSSGTVTLSGGDYPALGALLYLRSASGAQALGGSIGCVLPGRSGEMCRAIVNDFVSTFSGVV
jgi:hypothetical protein